MDTWIQRLIGFTVKRRFEGGIFPRHVELAPFSPRATVPFVWIRRGGERCPRSLSANERSIFIGRPIVETAAPCLCPFPHHSTRAPLCNARLMCASKPVFFPSFPFFLFFVPFFRRAKDRERQLSFYFQSRFDGVEQPSSNTASTRSLRNTFKKVKRRFTDVFIL